MSGTKRTALGASARSVLLLARNSISLSECPCAIDKSRQSGNACAGGKCASESVVSEESVTGRVRGTEDVLCDNSSADLAEWIVSTPNLNLDKQATSHAGVEGELGVTSSIACDRKCCGDCNCCWPKKTSSACAVALGKVVSIDEKSRGIDAIPTVGVEVWKQAGFDSADIATETSVDGDVLDAV